MARQDRQIDAFSAALAPRLADDLARQNPWWSDRAMPQLPGFRRWPFEPLLKRILREKPIAPINVVRGPRQIGKTTLQYQIIEWLLSREGVEPKRIFRAQFDELPYFREAGGGEPILRIAEWYERTRLGGDFNAAARAGKPAFLFLDEVQNVADWDVQLKALVDRSSLRVVVTGSSALRIQLGRDSLAGRIQTLEVGPFRLAEIAAVGGLGSLRAFEEGNGNASWVKPAFWNDLASHVAGQSRIADKAFEVFSERGGYPLAQDLSISWPEVAQQLNETVIKRVIQHDLRIGERGRRRDEQLLEETFRLTARYCGQTPKLSELAQQARESIDANVGVQRIRSYIDFLDSSLLIRSVQPHEMRLKKRRSGPKFCLSDHALRAAWLNEVVPLAPRLLDGAPELADLAGRIAESCVGYYLLSLGMAVSHLPERADANEIDYILTVGDYRVPIEVKYRRQIDPIRDTASMRAFMERKVNRAPIGLLITRSPVVAELPKGILAVPLSHLLLVR